MEPALRHCCTTLWNRNVSKIVLIHNVAVTIIITEGRSLEVDWLNFFFSQTSVNKEL